VYIGLSCAAQLLVCRRHAVGSWVHAGAAPTLLLAPLWLQSATMPNTAWLLLCLQVALKLEHRSSKGCNYGPPYEWSVYGCAAAGAAAMEAH